MRGGRQQNWVPRNNNTPVQPYITTEPVGAIDQHNSTPSGAASHQKPKRGPRYTGGQHFYSTVATDNTFTQPEYYYQDSASPVAPFTINNDYQGSSGYAFNNFVSAYNQPPAQYTGYSYNYDPSSNASASSNTNATTYTNSNPVNTNYAYPYNNTSSAPGVKYNNNKVGRKQHERNTKNKSRNSDTDTTSTTSAHQEVHHGEATTQQTKEQASHVSERPQRNPRAQGRNTQQRPKGKVNANPTTARPSHAETTASHAQSTEPTTSHSQQKQAAVEPVMGALQQPQPQPQQQQPPPQQQQQASNKFVPKSTNYYRQKSRQTGDADDLPSSIGDHTMLASKIIVKLNQNTYECMVCFDVISRKAPVWWCENCFALFHLSCVDKWSSKSYNEGGKLGWRCPGCQGVYHDAPESRCFCRKVLNPTFNPYFLPHSCGENCGKVRGVGCPHKCALLCHPGTCPPCTILGVTKTCYCGKETYRLRCGEVDKGRPCDEKCEKLLACGKHYCAQDCHPGACSACNKLVPQSCYCGKVTENRICGTGVVDKSQREERFFKCKGVCGKYLGCGKHQCEEPCHPGPCKECAFLPSKVSTCPCGSTMLSVVRKSCTDPIPTCNSVCDKALPCGKHLCVEKCHIGECPPCMQEVSVKCRCGSTTATLPCSSAMHTRAHGVACNSVCTKQRSCGRHKCLSTCCASLADPTDPEGNHVCTLLCGRPLQCGVHTCDMLCHKGKCQRCTRLSFDELACTCGKTIIYPPVQCGTPIPACTHPCHRSRACGHADVLIHECHPGDCPPCAALVEKMCVGGHELRRNIRCSQVEVSCGRQCAKTMPCGQHVCPRLCHSGACAPVSAEQGVSCGLKCNTKLSTCEHTCLATCHPGATCPVVLCNQISKVSCPCGRRTGEAVCNHQGDGVVTGAEAKPLTCDEQCELKERNKKLAEAFGISPTGNKAPQYSDLLLNLIRVSPQLVKKLEQVFDDFLRTPPSNTKLNLPVMDRVKRQLVHELAKYYHLETQSLDKEPLRSVVITRTRESKTPNILLSDYVPALPIRQPAPPSSNASSSSSSSSARAPIAALHIYNLQSYVKTPHLVAFLQPFAGHYKLQWVDDGNCLALFDSELTMRTAFSQLSGGMFSVKVYKDQLEASPTEFHMTPLPQKERKPLPTFTPVRLIIEDEPWRKDDNVFKSLNDVDNTTTTTTTTTSTLAWSDDAETQKSDDDKDDLSVKDGTTTTGGRHSPTVQTRSTEPLEDGFKVIKSAEELDDWTMLDDSIANK